MGLNFPFPWDTTLRKNKINTLKSNSLKLFLSSLSQPLIGHKKQNLNKYSKPQKCKSNTYEQ